MSTITNFIDINRSRFFDLGRIPTTVESIQLNELAVLIPTIVVSSKKSNGSTNKRLIRAINASMIGAACPIVSSHLFYKAAEPLRYYYLQ